MGSCRHVRGSQVGTIFYIDAESRRKPGHVIYWETVTCMKCGKLGTQMLTLLNDKDRLEFERVGVPLWNTKILEGL